MFEHKEFKEESKEESQSKIYLDSEAVLSAYRKVNKEKSLDVFLEAVIENKPYACLNFMEYVKAQAYKEIIKIGEYDLYLLKQDKFNEIKAGTTSIPGNALIIKDHENVEFEAYVMENQLLRQLTPNNSLKQFFASRSGQDFRIMAKNSEGKILNFEPKVFKINSYIASIMRGINLHESFDISTKKLRELINKESKTQSEALALALYFIEVGARDLITPELLLTLRSNRSDSRLGLINLSVWSKREQNFENAIAENNSEIIIAMNSYWINDLSLDKIELLLQEGIEAGNEHALLVAGLVYKRKAITEVTSNQLSSLAISDVNGEGEEKIDYTYQKKEKNASYINLALNYFSKAAMRGNAAALNQLSLLMSESSITKDYPDKLQKIRAKYLIQSIEDCYYDNTYRSDSEWETASERLLKDASWSLNVWNTAYPLVAYLSYYAEFGDLCEFVKIDSLKKFRKNFQELVTQFFLKKDIQSFLSVFKEDWEFDYFLCSLDFKLIKWILTDRSYEQRLYDYKLQLLKNYQLNYLEGLTKKNYGTQQVMQNGLVTNVLNCLFNVDSTEVKTISQTIHPTQAAILAKKVFQAKSKGQIYCYLKQHGLFNNEKERIDSFQKSKDLSPPEYQHHAGRLLFRRNAIS